MPPPVDVLDRASTSVFEADTGGPQGKWVAKPVLARLVRIAVVVLPIVAATVVAFAMARVLPQTTTASGAWLQRGLVLAVAGAVAWMTGPLAKRLLPLSALLQLTLVFPDVAPRRMATALQSRSTQRLADLVETTRRSGLSSDASQAAGDILRLVGALSDHDRITRGHSERVRVYAALIGEQMGLSPERLDALAWAGLLHDVGKLTIDGAILNKPSSLSDGEYETIKTHAAAGQAMVEPLRGWLGGAVDAVGQHHERWDGGGYPAGLRGEEISLEARIMAVADVFDVITAARSYKAPSSPAEAREEIARCAGTQFDPEVVRAFLAISVGEFRVTRGPLAMLAQWPVVASISAAGPMPALGTAASTATIMVSASMGAQMVGMAPPAPFGIETVTVEMASVAGSEETTGPERASSELAPSSTVDSAGVAAEPTVPASAVAEETERAPAMSATAEPQEVSSPAEPTAVPAEEVPQAVSAPEGPAAEPADDRSYERALAELEEAARVERLAVETWLVDELAAIDAKEQERVQRAQDSFDEAMAEAAEERAEDEADLVEERAERDAEIRRIDQALAERLEGLRVDHDRDLAKIAGDVLDGKLTPDQAVAARAEVVQEYTDDVAAEQAKAQARRDREHADVAEAELEVVEEYEEETREAAEELAEEVARAERKRDEARREANARAEAQLAQLAQDLADGRRALDAEFGR